MTPIPPVEQHTPNISNPDFTRQPVFWQLIILLVLLISIFSSAIIREVSDFAPVAKPPQTTAHNAAAVISSDPTPIALPNVPVVGEAAYVFDMQTGQVLYEKNANEPLPLASVTKLMTALLAHELLDDSSTVGITYDAILQDGDSGLMGGERFTRDTLNDLVLMTSSNDGAFALANAAGEALLSEQQYEAFITAMNVRAEQLGYDTLSFYNPTGLDLDTTTPGATGSAADVASLMAYIVANYPEILTATTEITDRFYNDNGAYHDARNTNALAGDITGLIGSKTGYTELAGGNLVIAYDAGLNHPIVVVVLGSSRTERFSDVARLVEATNETLTTTP